MKTYLIDLDGTMYRGSQIIEGAKEFIDDLLAKNEPFYFLTNNAKRTLKQNVEHMEKLGFTGIKPDHFYTSAMGAAAYVAKTSPLREAWYIGEDGLKEALENEGFHINENKADFVFIGLDIKADYDKYCKALGMILNGAQLIGTNTDRLLAKPGGFNVGNGSIVHMFEYATGQKSPQLGKPYAPILESCLSHIHKDKDEVIILGDNLETDILLGTTNGVETLMVTSGVHKKSDVDKLKIYPDRIIDDLRELIK